ncbi:acyl-CoA dehydrogenase family protein [Polaromonas sp. SM01]|uniref:acyl-CoA dehydrogenase family protein n=1 Tax=Polaromonas sp. SM01 TaxID=3085630 RepID=UPI002982A2C4|nr:acyl-CoA dehydrogenase family protein [Polaromonas sp. SM01]MDW5444193.1 acyl-CoA dehydrogenase family protein [Polaromonas sp. SM01]
MSIVSNALLSEQEVIIRESARRVATEVVGSTAAERDRTSAWPHAEIKAVADVGFMGMLAPQAHGGSGLSFVEYCLVIEEFAAADGGFATIMHVHNSSAHVLHSFGTEAQMARYLPDLVSAKRIGAFLLSEPHAGSDTSAIRTTAKRDGDAYVINGSKQWISNGSEAGFALIVAATAEPGARNRFSLFIADPAEPGYQCLRIENKMGQHTAHTAQIQLDNMRVPAQNMIGEEGRGYGKALSLLSDGRIAIAALSIGVARAALEAAIRYAKEREAYGKPLTELQAVSFDLAEMAMQVEVAHQYMLYAARLTDAGLPAVKEAAIAKLYASEMAEKVCSAALQVHGGYGYVNDFPVERYYRDVRLTKIYEGTSHIQKLIIARNILAG